VRRWVFVTRNFNTTSNHGLLGLDSVDRQGGREAFCS
jgi:hypothetical protein